jgi:hypothetical protein
MKTLQINFYRAHNLILITLKKINKIPLNLKSHKKVYRIKYLMIYNLPK